jgi:hypothetical protein
VFQVKFLHSFLMFHYSCPFNHHNKIMRKVDIWSMSLSNFTTLQLL